MFQRTVLMALCEETNHIITFHKHAVQILYHFWDVNPATLPTSQKAKLRLPRIYPQDSWLTQLSEASEFELQYFLDALPNPVSTLLSINTAPNACVAILKLGTHPASIEHAVLSGVRTHVNCWRGSQQLPFLTEGTVGRYGAAVNTDKPSIAYPPFDF